MRYSMGMGRGGGHMMGGGGGGWWVYMRDNSDGEKPQVTWALLKRVLAYAKPYRWHIIGLLVTIIVTTLMGLLTPLIFRDLIDNALTNGDARRLDILALGLVAIPIVTGLIRVFQRKLNASVGEGVIYDLRVALFRHIQHMSIRFFTNTKTGELMSRLNNDVVG